MLMIIFLVGILAVALGVSAWLFVQLQRDAQDKAAVPVIDVKPSEQVEGIDPGIAVYEAEISELKKSMEDFQNQASRQEQNLSEAMNVLRAENEELRSSLAAARQDHEETDRLLVENATSRVQINEVSVQIRQLRENVNKLEKENAGLRSSSEAVVDATIGSQKLLQTAKEEYQQQLEGFYQQIEQLRTDNDRLLQQAEAGAAADSLKKEVDELASRVRELETENGILMEKNKYFQYELTKSRAQVVGLERLCENMQVTRSLAVAGVDDSPGISTN